MVQKPPQLFSPQLLGRGKLPRTDNLEKLGRFPPSKAGSQVSGVCLLLRQQGELGHFCHRKGGLGLEKQGAPEESRLLYPLLLFCARLLDRECTPLLSFCHFLLNTIAISIIIIQRDPRICHCFIVTCLPMSSRTCTLPGGFLKVKCCW